MPRLPLWTAEELRLVCELIKIRDRDLDIRRKLYKTRSKISVTHSLRIIRRDKRILDKYKNLQSSTEYITESSSISKEH